MNIKEIATACADRVDPTLKRTIDSHANATHPEILIGNKVMVEKRNKTIETISLAIADALVADRLCREARENAFYECLKEIAEARDNPLYMDSSSDLLEELIDRAAQVAGIQEP
jgi:predicted DNA-binding ribbon-helix-helix protein